MPYKDAEQHRLYRIARQHKHRKFLQDYKVEHGCKDCGYNEHHAGLEFDHIGDDKVYNLGNMAPMSMAKILVEVAKCEVVCGTCHNIRTWNRRQELDKDVLV